MAKRNNNEEVAEILIDKIDELKEILSQIDLASGKKIEIDTSSVDGLQLSIKEQQEHTQELLVNQKTTLSQYVSAFDSSLKQILSERLNSFREALPTEIKINRQNTVEFKDKTKQVILVTFLCTSLVIAGAGWFAVNTYKKRVDTEQLLKNNYTHSESNWLMKFHNEFRVKHPKDSEKFIELNGEIPTPSKE